MDDDRPSRNMVWLIVTDVIKKVRSENIIPQLLVRIITGCDKRSPKQLTALVSLKTNIEIHITREKKHNCKSKEKNWRIRFWNDDKPKI